MIVNYFYSNNGATERHRVQWVSSDTGEPVRCIPKWVDFVVKRYARKFGQNRNGQYKVIRKSKTKAGIKRISPVPQSTLNKELPI